MKERKTRSKFTILILACFVLFASVWAGRTFAYFNASSNASGTITMGTLKVNDFGGLDASASLKVVPNQTVTKNFKATIESDIKYYKRLSLSATVEVETGKTHDSTCGDYVDDDTKILNATVQGFEKYTADDDSIYYYSLTPVTPTATNTTEEFSVQIKIKSTVGAGGCDYYMGATIKVNVKVEVIQADYLEDNGLANLNTFTDAKVLHNVWTSCCPTSDYDMDDDVQDVSAYPDLEFSVLSTSARTMSVKQATTSTQVCQLMTIPLSQTDLKKSIQKI